MNRNTRSTFDSLKREDRERLFPKGKKRAYIFGPLQLRALYGLLPTYEVPFVRFAAHSGMRLREITTLTWGNVDLESKTVHVEERYAKNGNARDVVLGDVAQSILGHVRPANVAPTDHVFLGKGGRPIRDVRGGFEKAVLKVWKPARPDQKKPRFHDLRKTSATCVEAASSHAVAKAFLGHSDEDVTDSHIEPSAEDIRRAVNRAAVAIDGGEICRDGTNGVTVASEGVQIGERKVLNAHA
jgi:integrase